MGKKNRKKKAKAKWNFAIGTTSRVPKAEGYHYLILDFDGPVSITNCFGEMIRRGISFKIQETPNGIHVYTNFTGTLDQVSAMARDFGADMNWIFIARKRGYFFLADKNIVLLDWPVERMIIHHGKKETRDSTRT